MKVLLSEAAIKKVGAIWPDHIDHAPDARLIECRAEVLGEEVATAETMKLVTANMAKGGPPQLNDAQKPTILRMVAWLAHEGVNNNRQHFLAEDLKEAVDNGLFQEPDFGLMDFNHSSAMPWATDDPKMIGVWYDAAYAFDEKAGKHGIAVRGVLFAWAFPEHASIMLGEQERSGHMSFSMAALPIGGRLLGEDDDGIFETLHTPIFFGLSALDVPPADIHATGHGTEDSNITFSELESKTGIPASLFKDPTLLLPLVASLGDTKKDKTWHQLNTNGLLRVASSSQEDDIMEELLAAMKEEKEAAELRATEIAEKLGASTVEAADAVAKLAAADIEIAALGEKIEAMQADLDEKATLLEAGQTAATAAATAYETLEAENKELATKVTEFEAQESATAQAAKLVERKAALPETFLEVHNAREDEARNRVELTWAAKSDDEWTQHVEDVIAPFFTANDSGYQARSKDEGPLATGSLSSSSVSKRLRSHIK